ncbi:hypothetical protein N656DRAFT_779317 [Canariomyces notabilis]|uniref:Uncharacterized protein n=1 Tax=Canariomyces notabilis TaxID=2074819 RepID=A0AAN6YRY2_9PEZI|nr:hypothetical protein N656DRAFT_779317 [Canariomyces arenarius]
MSLITERTVLAARRLALANSTTSSAASMLPRAAFSTSTPVQRSAVESAKDALKSVDRKVSDKLVDGINIGATVAEKLKDASTATVAEKLKEASSEVSSGKVTGKAAELRGEAAGKASEMAGKAKGMAGEVEGKAKGAAAEVEGKAKEAKEEVKEKLSP